MRKLVEQIKTYYIKGIYSYADVQKLLEKGKITEEEFIYIVGENH